MLTYYCKNCNTTIGFFNIIKKYIIHINCNFIESKNNKFTYFIDCNKCKKFIGIICTDVCKNCFGKTEIYEEENLFNWFQKYKKITNYNYTLSRLCKNCNNKDDFRYQYWFFEELTFYEL